MKIYLTNGFTVCQLYVKVMTISHCDKNAALSVVLGEGGSSLPEITCLQVASVCCVTKTMVFTFTHRIEYKSRLYTELAASFSSYPSDPHRTTPRHTEVESRSVFTDSDGYSRSYTALRVSDGTRPSHTLTPIATSPRSHNARSRVRFTLY